MPCVPFIIFIFVTIVWRRGRDSNPRWRLSHNGFQDRRDRPLCHPSGVGLRLRLRLRTGSHRPNLVLILLLILIIIMILSGLAGREGLEPPTDGFGDRYSTN